MQRYLGHSSIQLSGHSMPCFHWLSQEQASTIKWECRNGRGGGTSRQGTISKKAGIGPTSFWISAWSLKSPFIDHSYLLLLYNIVLCSSHFEMPSALDHCWQSFKLWHHASSQSSINRIEVDRKYWSLLFHERKTTRRQVRWSFSRRRRIGVITKSSTYFQSHPWNVGKFQATNNEEKYEPTIWADMLLFMYINSRILSG